MRAVLRWGLICGGVIILADLIAALLSAGQPSDSTVAGLAQTIDLLVNLSLYSYCGYRVGTVTRVVRSAAEAEVLILFSMPQLTELGGGHLTGPV